MATTQSGFEVIPRYGHPLIKKCIVNGVNAAPGVRSGDVHTILKWVMKRFNETVSPLRYGDCWGYAPRQIRGGTGWSNHASGTAVDLNGSLFKQGTKNMTTSQIRACRQIVIDSGGVIRWGGDYTGAANVDQMHFEINDNLAGTKRLADFARKIRKMEVGDMPSAEEIVDELLSREFDFNDYNMGIKDGETGYTERKLPLSKLIPVLLTYSSIAANRSKQAARRGGSL